MDNKTVCAFLAMLGALGLLYLSGGGSRPTRTELPRTQDITQRTDKSIESAGNAVAQGRAELENAVKRVDECERLVGESTERLTDRREIIARLKDITVRAERLIDADGAGS